MSIYTHNWKATTPETNIENKNKELIYKNEHLHSQLEGDHPWNKELQIKIKNELRIMNIYPHNWMATTPQTNN